MRTKIETKLTIRGEEENLKCLLARVEGSLRDGWTRNYEAEARLRHFDHRERLEYCFACTSKADRPAAGFFLRPSATTELCVQHVLPRLTDEDTLRILVEFDREFLAPAAAGLGVTTEINQRRVEGLEYQLSANAIRRLREFSESANRECILQPKDRPLWNAFVVCVHKDDTFFEPELLDEWLQEKGWPKATRQRLLEEYDVAQTLLLAYDEEAKRR